jgi:hypothetical protein
LVILIMVFTANLGKFVYVSQRAASLGNEINFLFIGKGSRLIDNHQFVDSISFARLFVLKDNCKNPVKGLEFVDYDGWIKLLEICDTTINWF